MKVTETAKTIIAKRSEMPTENTLLVGISGIDGSGKGFITARLTEKIRRTGVNAVGINIDGWLNLPQIRSAKTNTAENFYCNAIRFEEMFEQLILPLKQDRSINLIADFLEETDEEYHKYEYAYANVDIILLEGIYLFKQGFRKYFDLKIWVECSFETALTRAIQRSQEGLAPEETIAAYQSIYFPAQQLHFDRDDPKTAADITILNDDRLRQADKPH